jgi:hypothetical protein
MGVRTDCDSRTGKLERWICADIAPSFRAMAATQAAASLERQGLQVVAFATIPRRLWREGKRRAPRQSKSLKKVCCWPQLIAHGGSQIIQRFIEYKALRNWIAAVLLKAKLADRGWNGKCTRKVNDSGHSGQQQQLIALAIQRWTEGYDTPGALHAQRRNRRVHPEGSPPPSDVSTDGRSLGAVGVSRMAVVLRPPLKHLPTLVRNNYIDDLIFEKLLRLRMLPSALCSDSEFIRRVHLDVMGTLPGPAEVRAFLADRSPEKRERLVDTLFTRPEYADFWSMKYGIYSPTVRSSYTTGPRITRLCGCLQNKPYDQLPGVAHLRGALSSPANHSYTFKRSPKTWAFVSQAFLASPEMCPPP